ncbi:MAG TPA: carotenoid oxygenase family protein [Streptosporangiaceae bacterium]|nr:carotenoid oxygenase family protein [Streptosporangiaceae bacterium]HEX2820153.1 carotenoid oxygenase family protein [Streptosporangiaceae bacterium]
MADDWRVTATFGDAPHVGRAVRAVREHQVDDEVRGRLGPGVAMSADLVILAAQDFTGPPVARVHLPARIPLGFHGSWIADQWFHRASRW